MAIICMILYIFGSFNSYDFVENSEMDFKRTLIFRFATITFFFNAFRSSFYPSNDKNLNSCRINKVSIFLLILFWYELRWDTTFICSNTLMRSPIYVTVLLKLNFGLFDIKTIRDLMFSPQYVDTIISFFIFTCNVDKFIILLDLGVLVMTLCKSSIRKHTYFFSRRKVSNTKKWEILMGDLINFSDLYVWVNRDIIHRLLWI